MRNNSPDIKIVLIGSGNLATHLGKALKKRNYTIVQVFSKTLANAKKLGEELQVPYSNQIKKLDLSADLYFLCVKDDVIHEIINKTDLSNKFIIHTSGSTPLSLLKPYSKNIGVFYPLQTFNKTQKIKFKEVPILIEANNLRNRKLLLDIANQISEKVYEIDSKQRQSLHLAAVFACNFTNHLYSIAEKICIENQIDFNLIKPLIKVTAKRIQENHPSEVQTGPAIRKDYKVIQMQELMLKDNLPLLELYKLFTSEIIKSIKD